MPLSSRTRSSKIGEAGTARALQLGADHFADDRGVAARFQRGDRLRAAAIFVADGKSKQQIFEGDEAGLREVGGAARADAVQVRERRVDTPARAAAVLSGRWPVRTGQTSGRMSLDDDGLTGLHANLADPRRQLEGIVQVHAVRDSARCASSS